MDLVLLLIDIGSAHRLYKLFVQTSEFVPLRRQRSRPELRKLDEYHELYIMVLIMNNPALYLAEICQKINDVTGVHLVQLYVEYFNEMGIRKKN